MNRGRLMVVFRIAVLARGVMFQGLKRRQAAAGSAMPVHGTVCHVCIPVGAFNDCRDCWIQVKSNEPCFYGRIQRPFFSCPCGIPVSMFADGQYR